MTNFMQSSVHDQLTTISNKEILQEANASEVLDYLEDMFLSALYAS